MNTEISSNIPSPVHYNNSISASRPGSLGLGSLGTGYQSSNSLRSIGAVIRGLPALEELEPIFSKLRGAGLILATLSYGLGVRITELRSVRVRDVNLSSGLIRIEGGVRAIPLLMIDDLREYIHERLCGSEASLTVSKREQRLFGDEAFESLLEQLSVFHPMGGSQELGAQGLMERCFNRIFRILAWRHARAAVRSGTKVRSPLELFDKGPRIVRRGRLGSVDQYYLWRTVYPAAGC